MITCIVRQMPWLLVRKLNFMCDNGRLIFYCSRQLGVHIATGHRQLILFGNGEFFFLVSTKFSFMISTKFSFMIIRTNRKISEKKTILVPDFFRWRIYILNVSFRDTFESRPSKILCRLTGYTLHFFFLFWYSLIIRPYILTHVFKGIRIPLWKRLQYY